MLHPRRALAGFAILLSFAVSPVNAQSGDAPTLLTLDSGAVQVRYAPGSLDRASKIHDLLYELVTNYTGWSRTRVLPMALILDREQWATRQSPRPYGLPVVIAPGQVALPAFGDEGTISLWRGYLGGWLPLAQDNVFGGKLDEASSLLAADYLGYVEVSKSLIERGGFRADEAWILDVASHIQAITGAGRVRSEAVFALTTFFQRLAQANEAEAVSLGTYADGVSFARWLWFQGRFQEAALIVVNADGWRSMKRIRKIQGKSPDDLVTSAALVERYPALVDWLESF